MTDSLQSKELTEHQVCRVCGRILPLSRFFKNYQTSVSGIKKTYYVKKCRDCYSAENKERRRLAKLELEPDCIPPFPDAKKCTCCDTWLPATLEYFPARGDKTGGLRATCRKCTSQKKRTYYVLNKEKIQAKHREDMEAGGRERKSARSRERYKQDAAYRSKVLANNARRRRELSPDKKAKQAEYMAQWSKTPNGVLSCKLAKQKYKNKKRCRGSLTKADILKVVSKYRGSSGVLYCGYCGKEILEDSWHLEHKTPISRGGTNDIDNLAISCMSCNLSKASKTVEEYVDWCKFVFGYYPTGRACNVYFVNLVLDLI